MSKIINERACVCFIYDLQLGNLRKEHELGTRENLCEDTNLILEGGTCTILRNWYKSSA